MCLEFGIARSWSVAGEPYREPKGLGSLMVKGRAGGPRAGWDLGHVGFLDAKDSGRWGLGSMKIQRGLGSPHGMVSEGPEIAKDPKTARWLAPS